MSSNLTGKSSIVFEGLRRASNAAAREGHVVTNATFYNPCPLPEG
jgi:hypothetical protein